MYNYMKEKEEKMDKLCVTYRHRLRSDIYCQYQKSSIMHITYIITAFGKRAISDICVILSLSFITA